MEMWDATRLGPPNRYMVSVTVLLLVAGRREGAWPTSRLVQGYLHKLHIAEDMHGVVWCVQVVAAAAELCVTAPKVTAFTVRRLRTVQAAAARRGPIYCREEREREVH